jgi:hypothetical protein
MYSRKTWGGPVEPHILVKFLPYTGQDETDPIASMIVFEWKDYALVGIQPEDPKAPVKLFRRTLRLILIYVFRKNGSATRPRRNLDGVMAIRRGNFLL